MLERCKFIIEKTAYVKDLCAVFTEEIVEARKIRNLDTLEDLKKSIIYDLSLLMSHFEDFMGEYRLYLQNKLGFKKLGNFGEGLAAARHDNAYFYVDPKGKTIIEGPFDVAEVFENGKAKVCFKADCWYIDKTGKKVSKNFSRATGRFK